MSRPATWKVLRWDNKPPDIAPGEPISLICDCGREAELETCGAPGSLILATLGMSLVFDQPGHVPPPYWMPLVIQCRKCKAIYGNAPEDVDVR